MLICILWTATACSAAGQQKPDETDIMEYSFTTGLLSKKEAYPISVGTTYYIASGGDVSADGLTPESPMPFSQVATLPLTPGVSVLFKRGDKFIGQIILNDVIGQDNNPVTFASYGEGAKPVIEFAGNPVAISKCSNLVVRDLTISVIGIERPDGPSRRGIYCTYNNVGANKYRNLYIVNNTVYSGGTTVNVFGISITHSAPTAGSCDVLTGLYVLGNEVYNIGRSGIVCQSYISSQTNPNVGRTDIFRNVHFDRNTVRDAGQIGMWIANGTTCTMNRNLVYNTGMFKGKSLEGAGGMMALNSEDIDIMYNESCNNRDATGGYDAMAIDIDWNTNNIDVRYNHASGNMGGGIGTMSCSNSFIRNNRVENNECATNMSAQIQVSDFTVRDSLIPVDRYAVRNVHVTDNLITGTPDGKSMFRAQKFNGDPTWQKNEFTRNRVVYAGENADSINWIFVDIDAPWYKFADNRYFAGDTSVFKCIDNTPAAQINGHEGAEACQFSKTFPSWAKRDAGSTLSVLNSAVPGKPSKPVVTYENGELKISWKKSDGRVWLYNVYSTETAAETVDYRCMLGQTRSESFAFKPEHKGVYYITVRPESETGNYGEDLKIKIIV
ncbi:MAG: right-handed parallel beta-helix repeat-containing protein [Prevotellaceae bacterium]|nr:right-handed parallel beta-helix repeat-containing protein [Prevotellaceae bacterium]